VVKELKIRRKDITYVKNAMKSIEETI